jgi:hypothetical protein
MKTSCSCSKQKNGEFVPILLIFVVALRIKPVIPISGVIVLFLCLFVIVVVLYIINVK